MAGRSHRNPARSLEPRPDDEQGYMGIDDLKDGVNFELGHFSDWSEE
jgi:hypothetical protein